MRAYAIRRLFLLIPTLFVVSVVVFLLCRLVPGGVLDLMLAQVITERSTPEQQIAARAMLEHKLGLDVPIHIQYGRWLGFLPTPELGFSGVFQGNLGNSLWSEQPIVDDLRRRLPVSIELGLIAQSIALALAIPIGVYSATRQDTLGDYGGRTFAIVALSVPAFWVATMVTVYPSIWWNWSPPAVYIPLVKDPLANLAQFLLPGLLMGLHSCGSMMRMTRTMMLEVLRQDYIRTAWSKGLSERVVIYRHAMKNAMIPVVTQFGHHIPMILGGTVVIEVIFNLPGIGRLMVGALSTRDYPVISALNLMTSCVVVCANLIVDLSYGWIDPRIVYK